MFLVEVPSTFNEQCVVDYLLETESDDFFTLNVIENFMSFIQLIVYSQCLSGDFEFKIYKQVESGQPVNAEWLNQTFLSAMREFYGHEQGVVLVPGYYQYAWTQNT
ncbi:hypothetical protein JW960_21990 [candidate division KSB1 bacterium]|nr:hypothetical protein [candidate division KSB1 bacterium]